MVYDKYDRKRKTGAMRGKFFAPPRDGWPTDNTKPPKGGWPCP